MGPNFIEWNAGGFLTKSVEFRTHNKFSKRLLHGLYPVWWLAHQWDMLIANNIQPAWNLGFDTLTAYPDADPETNSVDGEVRRSPASPFETWNAIRTGAGDASSDNTATGRVFLAYFNTGHDFLWRIIHLYDTSSLTSGATISAAVSSFVTNSVTDGWTDSVSVAGCTPASNTALVNADFNIANHGSTDFGNVTLASLTADGSTYNDITLNASGEAAISLTSITKFSYRFTRDVTNTDPSGSGAVNSNITLFLADETGTSKDPKLVITFTAGTDYTRDLVDSLGLTDSLNVATTYSRSVVDSEGVTDSLAPTVAYVRTKVNNMGIADISNVGLLIDRSLLDSLGVTDIVSYTVVYNINLSDTMGIEDSLTRANAHVRSIIDSEGLSDVLDASFTYGRSVTDSMGITDTLNAGILINIGLADSMGITDVVTMAERILKQSIVQLEEILDIKVKLEGIDDK